MTRASPLNGALVHCPTAVILDNIENLQMYTLDLLHFFPENSLEVQ